MLLSCSTKVLIGVVCNVILNLVLIPEYKALGAALATLLTQFSTLFAQMLLAKKIFRLPFRGLYALQVIAFAGLVAGLTYVSYYHFSLLT